jgi:hypothetical protein
LGCALVTKLGFKKFMTEEVAGDQGRVFFQNLAGCGVEDQRTG